MDPLREISREQERLRDSLAGGLEAALDKRLTERLEQEFARKLEVELRERDMEVGTLKSRIRELEASRGHVTDEQSGKTGAYDATGKVSGTSMSSLQDTVRRLSFAKYVRTIATVQLIICFLTSLTRADLFSVVVVIALYAVHENDKEAMLSFLLFQTFSIIVDIAWLGTHGDTSSFAVTAAYKGAMAFVTAMTVLGLLFKVLVMWPAFQHFRDLPAIKPSDQARLATTIETKSFVEKLATFALVLQLGICFFNSLARADMYGLVIVIGLYAMHEKDRRAMRAFFVFLWLSIALDIAWLVLKRQYVSTGSSSDTARSAQPELFVWWMSIINLFLKFLFMFPAARVTRSLPEMKPSERPLSAPITVEGGTPIARFVKNLPWAKVVLGFAFTQAVLCFFEGIVRMDVFAVVIVVGLYAVNEKDKPAMELFISLMAFSVIVDLAWLGLHADPSKFTFASGTVGAMQFVIIVAAIGLVLKLIAFIPAVKHRDELPDVKPSDIGTAVETRRKMVSNYYRNFAGMQTVEKYRHIMYGFAAIGVVIFFFQSLDRVDPYGIIVLALLYAINERDRTALMIFLVFANVSFILDIVWLASRGDEIKAIAEAIESGTWSSLNISESLQFTFAMCIIGMIVKFVAIFPGFFLLKCLPSKSFFEGEESYEGITGPVGVPIKSAISLYSDIGRKTPPPDLYTSALPPPPAPLGPQTASYIPVYDDRIDMMMADYVNSNAVPVTIVRQGPGIYMFGTRRVICKILNERLVARVGGGYLLFEEFVDTYGPVEAEKARNEQGGFTAGPSPMMPSGSAVYSASFVSQADSGIYGGIQGSFTASNRGDVPPFGGTPSFRSVEQQPTSFRTVEQSQYQFRTGESTSFASARHTFNHRS
mmetsp:Transcript_19541/g.33541  ORF Transcript_19541/g.33541 Transcript_19541/m.33541 type:complete len:878 (-) Transcript_19541:402-3035(-)|eukprot:CAMPEP_0196664578 /NCGR_PEP_ID=MMETSP1086-20130531/57609_1 /TAXON_ID=77921 /ORGANISM="Cyanoptyche  gloeocystis , Strain SAG4.97" /LENGTH=877 /DNA_ID=CAMNT_0042000951 /DNA_START=78 /DNA_END=2711 /DNA_ORIENTATION=-